MFMLSYDVIKTCVCNNRIPSSIRASEHLTQRRQIQNPQRIQRSRVQSSLWAVGLLLWELYIYANLAIGIGCVDSKLKNLTATEFWSRSSQYHLNTWTVSRISIISSHTFIRYNHWININTYIQITK